MAAGHVRRSVVQSREVFKRAGAMPECHSLSDNRVLAELIDQSAGPANRKREFFDLGELFRGEIDQNQIKGARRATRTLRLR